MRQFLVSMVGSVCAFLAGTCLLPAAEVPDTASSSAPALAAVGDRVVLAWAGEHGVNAHQVWYSTFENGVFTPQTSIPGALTTSAPALASAGQTLYLATTPPGVEDQIYIYAASGVDFAADSTPLCDGDVCAHTRAAPALKADGSTLYAAWTTPAGQIRYATRTEGEWKIATLPIPGAQTSPTTGPTLAVFEHQLYVAWVEPSGQRISVIAAALPLSSSPWSAQPVIVPVETKVAPALSVFTIDNPVPGAAAETVNQLFLAWTSEDATLNFARWTGTAWQAAQSPVELPSGAITDDSPALLNFAYVLPDAECIRTNDVAWTGDKRPRRIELRQIIKPCP
jgi:hypothetical protein